jgi:hypothetical protein
MCPEALNIIVCDIPQATLLITVLKQHILGIIVMGEHSLSSPFARLPMPSWPNWLSPQT